MLGGEGGGGVVSLVPMVVSDFFLIFDVFLYFFSDVGIYIFVSVLSHLFFSYFLSSSFSS